MVKIGTKLGIGIGVLVVLCVSIGLISYQQTQLVGEKLQELARDPGACKLGRVCPREPSRRDRLCCVWLFRNG